MGNKNKWMMWLMNAILGLGYIAAILFMIHWVSSGNMGIAAFFIPIGLLIVMIIGWTVPNRKYIPTPRTYP